MDARIFRMMLAVVCAAGIARAQEAAEPATATDPPGGAAATAKPDTPKWRAVDPSTVRQASGNDTLDALPLAPVTSAPASPGPISSATNSFTPVSSTPRQPIARVTKGPQSLPTDAGQEWREYDISPYTARVTTTARPQQAIVDWILRDTGYEAWHSDPLGVLSANKRTLRVYHTPQMHALVSEIVDRFVTSEAESYAFGLRVVTLGSPNWRAKAQPMLHPVTTHAPGIQAWLMAKEDAALLLADMRKRTDFREHSSPHLLVNNGQATIITATRPRNYVRNVSVRSGTWPGYEPDMAQIDEGFSLEFSPLLSIDGRTLDAVIKCNVDQVEKMIPVMIDVPTTVAPRQRTKVEVPQLTSCRLHERFRWPADQVLLISLGVVASPAAKSTNPLALLGASSKADLLVLVESRGKMTAGAPAAETARRDANNYRGRY